MNRSFPVIAEDATKVHINQNKNGTYEEFISRLFSVADSFRLHHKPVVLMASDLQGESLLMYIDADGVLYASGSIF